MALGAFFRLKAVYGGNHGGFPQYMSVIPLNSNLLEKNVIIPFRYINISNVYQVVDSLYFKPATASN